MTTVLITGVAGFIGSHLSEKLLKEGMQVIGIDNFDPFYDRKVKEENLSASRSSKNFFFHEVSINDSAKINEIFLRHKIDVVIHLAAKAGVRPSLADPVSYISTNIEGLCSVLEAARKNKVNKIIFGSSSSVYGTNEKVPFCESDPIVNMISPYAMTKKSGEDLCRVYHNTYKTSVICLRFFTVYGPRQRPDLAIHKFFKYNMTNKEIELFGDGSMSRDYTFVSDIVGGIVNAVTRLSASNNPIFEIFNLGNSSPIKLNELILAIETTTGISSIVRYSDTPLGDVPSTYADISSAIKELGYKPKTDLKEGLRVFHEWMLSKI